MMNYKELVKASNEGGTVEYLINVHILSFKYSVHVQYIWYLHK